MDMWNIQSQLRHNAAMITNLEAYVKLCKEVMQDYLSVGKYADARLVQKDYKLYTNNLRSLVALQKALKKDKREKVAMWRFQRDVEMVKAALGIGV